MERLSPSPSILDIYAYCGTSVVVQPMEVGLSKRIVPKPGLASQEELDKLDDVYPRNNLTNSEKLQISLEMARSLADLHGFEGGPIAQGDVHADQWLVSASGSIKLNDFNYAVIPEWNSAKQNYCLEDEQKEWGDELNRAPQEYSGDDQDESIDTYSFGNIMYQMVSELRLDDFVIPTTNHSGASYSSLTPSFVDRLQACGISMTNSIEKYRKCRYK